MMDWTDRHDRFLLRLISGHAWLFTEMVTARAIHHGDRDHLLKFDAAEHPVAVQLGGAEPRYLAEAAGIATDYGYDEVNLNVGCPSDRVQSGRFGACLMAEPDLVATCVAAMQAATSLPVTVKCRIGIDDMDSETGLDRFVDTVADAGVSIFTVHARKAWLQGLSPKENRTIPPLDYDRVRRLKARRPDLTILLNGGLNDWDAVEAVLRPSPEGLPALDGVMVGREAYQNPWFLSEVDSRLYGAPSACKDRLSVAAAMAEYAREQMSLGVPIQSITRHMVGLFQGQPGAKQWRRMLSDADVRRRYGADLLDRAVEMMAERRVAA